MIGVRVGEIFTIARFIKRINDRSNMFWFYVTMMLAYERTEISRWQHPTKTCIGKCKYILSCNIFITADPVNRVLKCVFFNVIDKDDKI